MTFTKRTTITWNSPNQRTEPAMQQAKKDKLTEMGADSKTDNLPTLVDEVTTIRLWSDQAAAEEWINFITTLSAQYGYTATTIIEDYIPLSE